MQLHAGPGWLRFVVHMQSGMKESKKDMLSFDTFTEELVIISYP